MWSLITQHISRLVLRNRIMSAVPLLLVTEQNMGYILEKYARFAFMNAFAAASCHVVLSLHAGLHLRRILEGSLLKIKILHWHRWFIHGAFKLHERFFIGAKASLDY